MKKTKRRFLGSLGALALLSGAAGLVPDTRAEQPILPGVVDMTVQITSVPAEVAPPGELVMFAVSVGQGLVPSAGQVAIDLAPGQVYADDLTDGTNTASGADVSCDATGDDVLCSVPAAAETFEVVAFTAPTAGPQTTTATVTSTDPTLSVLEYSANNSSSTVTDVQQPTQEGQVSGVVRKGESITLTSNDGSGREYTLTVPADGTSPGVIVTIRLEDRPALCPTSTNPANGCGDGFVTTFVEDHPYFKALDPEHPLVTEKTFGYLGPCVGYGGTCSDIYYAADELALVLTKMPDCAGRSGATAGDGTINNEVGKCLNLKFKVGIVNWFEVLMLSEDPIEMPPVLRL